MSATGRLMTQIPLQKLVEEFSRPGERPRNQVVIDLETDYSKCELRILNYLAERGLTAEELKRIR